MKILALAFATESALLRVHEYLRVCSDAGRFSEQAMYLFLLGLFVSCTFAN